MISLVLEMLEKLQADLGSVDPVNETEAAAAVTVMAAALRAARDEALSGQAPHAARMDDAKAVAA